MAWLEPVRSTWAAGGPLLWPLALLSVGIWGYTFRSSGAIRGVEREARRLFLRLDRDEPWREGKGGWLERAFSGALGRIGEGARPMTALEQVETDCLEALRRDLLVLTALTTAAPLVGLLGTVSGMIQTFDAVSAVAGDTGQRVAGGISRALITTQFGLVIAMPGVFGVAHLRRLLRRTETTLAQCRFVLLERLAARR